MKSIFSPALLGEWALIQSLTGKASTRSALKHSQYMYSETGPLRTMLALGQLQSTTDSEMRNTPEDQRSQPRLGLISYSWGCYWTGWEVWAGGVKRWGATYITVNITQQPTKSFQASSLLASYNIWLFWFSKDKAGGAGAQGPHQTHAWLFNAHCPPCFKHTNPQRAVHLNYCSLSPQKLPLLREVSHHVFPLVKSPCLVQLHKECVLVFLGDISMEGADL